MEEIVDRIRKLLALSKSSNPNEAANAAAAAQKLMDRHRIEQAALEEPETEDEPIRDFEDPLDSGRRMPTWRKRLAVNIADANNCRIYLRHGGGTDVAIVGRAADAQTVRYLYAYCVREIDRLTRSHGSGNGRTWCNNFRIGCVDAIRIKLEAQREQVKREMLESSSDTERTKYAIQKVSDKGTEVERWVERNMNLRKAPRPQMRGDHGARRAGQRAGASINLNRGPGLGRGSAGKIGSG